MKSRYFEINEASNNLDNFASRSNAISSGSLYDEEDLGLLIDGEEEEQAEIYDSSVHADTDLKCSLEDALTYSVNNLGRVDIYYMAGIAGVTEDEILSFHAGKTIYQKPESYAARRKEYEDWVLEVEYLKGNLRDLLRLAETYNEFFGGRFDANIRLIKSRMPETPSFYDIHTRLGASWILGKYIGEFIAWLFKLPIKPEVTRADGRWKVRYIYEPLEVNNRYKYGTYRMSAMKIIDHTLNASSIKVRDEIEDYTASSGIRRVVNREETLAALNKQQLILDEFQEWMNKNPKVMEELIKAYSEIYSYAVPHYDGSMLRLEDLNSGVTLYKHQRDAVMRILLSRNTVLCHDVGSGKTYCYIVAVHEMHRTGVSARNMIVVPNSTFAGTVARHRKLYPDDKILEISPAAFKPGERVETIRRIREEDYVAIYIAASKFDMLTMTRSYALNALRNESKAADTAARSTTNGWVRGYYESKAERLDKKYRKMYENYYPDERGCFDTLGITTLVVDECQNYKNISVETNLDNVIGMRVSGSKKSDLMLDKVRQVQNSGGRIVFATGTLLTNSISDLYVFQYYLQPETLNGCSLSTFGEWANTFGSITTNFEVDVNSQDYRYVSRISHYHNLPELMAVFTEVCDFYHIGEEDMELPYFAGFKDVVVKPTMYHREFNKLIAERTDKVRKGKVKVREDNILRIVTDGRKAALDIRLVDPTAVVTDNECKAGACAREVASIYRDYPGTSQIIFCDYSTPKAGFNIYDEVKRILIANGVEEKEIAFIHDGTTEAKKNKLLRDLDAGKIRVMIGSTEKLGVGVNVQRHLIALHHIDAPWRPSDLTQREGRLIRQGNLNREVFEYRYITENSFDAYVWQILENKQHFIGSFLSGSMSEFHRTESEIDAIMLDLAEVKALAVGNPLIRERIITANSLERARISQRARYKQLYELREKYEEYPVKLREQAKKISLVKGDISRYNSEKKTMSREERVRYGEKLLKEIEGYAYKDHERLYGSYNGFGVYIPAEMNEDTPFIILKRGGGSAYYVDMKDKTAENVTQSMDGVMIGFSKRLQKLQKGYDKLLEEREETRKELSSGNEFDDEVEALKEKLVWLDEQLEAD